MTEKAVYQWRHEDERGIEFAFKVAVSAVTTFGFKDTTGDEGGAREQRANLRALLWMTTYVCDEFSAKPSGIGAEVDGVSAYMVHGPPYESSGERGRAVRLLLTTLVQLYMPIAKTTALPDTGSGAPVLTYPRAQTVRGEPGFTALLGTPPEVGALPAAAVTILGVVGILAATGAIVYLIEKGDEVLDRELARREQSNRVAQYHAALLALLAAHRKTEVEANEGKPMPLTPAEKAAMDALEKAQTEQLQAFKKDPGLKSIFPSGDKLVEGATKAATSFSTTVAVVAAVVGVFFLMQMQKGG